tara:strand:- start:369 stop:560 length:192 start_codon:yes stop_codon:yes gene_type:complete
MKEYFDMLIEGSHKLTKDQLHAWAKASRRRLKEGREVQARRIAASKNKTCRKFSPDINTMKDL